MSISYRDNVATFADVAAVEEAELLLEWSQSHAEARVDLAACTHLHPANLQVLMATMPVVIAWPIDAGLTEWIESALRRRRSV